MLAAAPSAAVLGIDALDVLVEVHVANGLPQWTMVGMKPHCFTSRGGMRSIPSLTEHFMCTLRTQASVDTQDRKNHEG